MNLDDFKEPWQQRQRDLGHQVDHVIKAVRSRMTWFDRVIWLRDLRESVVALLLIVWFGYEVYRNPAWITKLGFLLGILACAMIVVILNWVRITGREARPGHSLQDYCTAELARVDRQIWLLKHINWWYTGPLYVAVTIAMLGIMAPPKILIFLVTMLLPMAVFIHWLNQVAVRNELMPLRNDLASAMNVTEDDTMVQEGSTFPVSEPVQPNRKRVALCVVGWVALVLIGAYSFEQVSVDNDAPKVSPFTDLQFDNDRILVTYGDRTYQWLEIDGLKVEDIVTTCKWRFGSLWQKRIAEDLVFVLWQMDHYPGSTVSLRLLDLETQQDFIVPDAPMTSENRSAIYRRS